jgi:hypothetical protein
LQFPVSTHFTQHRPRQCTSHALTRSQSTVPSSPIVGAQSPTSVQVYVEPGPICAPQWLAERHVTLQRALHETSQFVPLSQSKTQSSAHDALQSGAP